MPKFSPTASGAAYDGAWKEALTRFLPGFVALFFPQENARIDWSRGFTFLDNELRRALGRRGRQGRRARHRRVDCLVRVYTRDGTEEWLLLHLEVQSAPEQEFAARIFDYFMLLRTAWPGVRVVPLVILADASPSWRPHAYVEEWAGLRIRFAFPICKLHALRRTLVRPRGVPALIARAQLAAHETKDRPGDRLAVKLRLVRALVGLHPSDEDFEHAFRALDWMMSLSEDADLKFTAKLSEFTEETPMRYTTSIERVFLRKGREEGRELGRELGREQGREQGRAEGQAVAMRGVAVLLLEKILGPLPAKLKAQVRALPVERLQELTPALLDFTTLADLRKWLAKKH